MQTESIITALLSAAAFLKKPVQDAAAQSIKDIYDAVKHYLRRRFGEGSDGAKVLELATAKPESGMRKAVLAEELSSARLHEDPEVIRLTEELAARLPKPVDLPGANVHVNGRGNRVLVAGRDAILTERVVHRSGIEPDERHLTAEQRSEIRAVIAELAARLAGDDSQPNFTAGHRMLQRRFRVLSYALLPREQFADAMRFLKQQRAIHRSRLRGRNPDAWQTDLYRATYSCARELGWDRKRIREFAEEKLGLKKPLTSFNELGPRQLKSLADLMHRQVRSARSKAGVHCERDEARQENS
ncbi:MAG: hypothetical protein Q8N18_26315 [Opitutaceae bacterium]|nr:hypothetical protein [Opitutaceae bacterium]